MINQEKLRRNLLEVEATQYRTEIHFLKFPVWLSFSRIITTKQEIRIRTSDISMS